MNKLKSILTLTCIYVFFFSSSYVSSQQNDVFEISERQKQLNTCVDSFRKAIAFSEKAIAKAYGVKEVDELTGEEVYVINDEYLRGKGAGALDGMVGVAEAVCRESSKILK